MTDHRVTHGQPGGHHRVRRPARLPSRRSESSQSQRPGSAGRPADRPACQCCCSCQPAAQRTGSAAWPGPVLPLSRASVLTGPRSGALHSAAYLTARPLFSECVPRLFNRLWRVQQCIGEINILSSYQLRLTESMVIQKKMFNLESRRYRSRCQLGQAVTRLFAVPGAMRAILGWKSMCTPSTLYTTCKRNKAF